MGEIDDHAELDHECDGIASERRQSTIRYAGGGGRKGRFPKVDARDRTRKLEVVPGALLGALDQTPPRDNPRRPAHLQQTRDLVALYANAAFVPNKQMDAVGAERNKKP